MQLDLGNLKSVRSFAENYLRSEPRLDILINNAGKSICCTSVLLKVITVDVSLLLFCCEPGTKRQLLVIKKKI